MKKALSLSIILLMVALYTHAQHKTAHKPATHHTTLAAVKVDTALSHLTKERIRIDDYKYANKKQQTFLVKVQGSKKLRKATEGEWPENTEYIYSIVKDKQGRVIRVEQSPYSQSGDWYIGYTHYFDAKGHTFCFEKVETLFDESVKGGLVMLTTLQYYNAANKMVSEKTTLTDKNSRPLKRKISSFNFRDDKYVVYKTSGDCVANYHIE